MSQFKILQELLGLKNPSGETEIVFLPIRLEN